MAGRRTGLLASGIVGRSFPGTLCRPQWLTLRARGFLAQSQWRDRAGFAPDFP